MSLEVEEIAALATIAKFVRARNILEIGTFDGNTALNLAANSPDDTAITTVDLPPSGNGKLKIEVPKDYSNITNRDKVGWQFHGTEHASKIKQVFGDSAELNWETLSPYPFDFVFIDGCHFREYVQKDTENAFRSSRPGGVVVWHDYGYFKHVSDVVDAIAEQRTVYAIGGTRLAIRSIE
jgi:predicted O-methyltransferase YrrM